MRESVYRSIRCGHYPVSGSRLARSLQSMAKQPIAVAHRGKNTKIQSEPENMKKLLFITPELPFPAQSGGKVKSLKLLQALAERYQVTLACPLKLDDARHVDDFQALSPCTNHLHQAVN